MKPMNNNHRNGIVAAAILMLLLGAFLPLHQVSAGQTQNPLRISVATDDDAITITYDIDGVIMNPVTISGQAYTIPRLSGESHLLIAGEPDLPLICRSVIIPGTARMQAQVTDASYVDYTGVRVAPSKGNLKRTVNPDEVPYTLGSVYDSDAWYPASPVSLREPYILRDYRGQTVVLCPVQYNPVRQTLRVYSQVTVQVTVVGEDTVNCLPRTAPVTKVDSCYADIYAHQFLNYGTGRYTPVAEQGNMLIITYDSFYQDMVPFLQWKISEGIPTQMVNVSTIGNANAIKSYIANYYNTQGLTFVLLVGDSAQLPTYMLSGDASDPSYSYVVGSDHYQDLFVGRFSAENNAQVQTQVQRSIEYERDPQISAAWYNKGLGIGSEFGPGDDNEYDYQHIRNIRTDLMSYTYTAVDELYGGSQGGLDPPGEPTTTMVATSVNDGRSIINYCGHGDVTLWGTSSFSVTNVNQLTNDNMLPFIDSVACYVGDFDGQTCFCEAWLRATHNGEPTGAIAHFGSTISQSWDPPMDAEDETVDLVCEHYTSNVKHTVGGIYYCGCMLMNDDYGTAGTGETDYWTIFGDPSLQIRTATPAPLSVTHNPGIPIGSEFFDVTVAGVQGARCAISRSGELIGVGYTDATGLAHILFNGPLYGAQPVKLVVTAYNKQPYMADLVVFAGSPPSTPAAPTGPAVGNVGVNYSFTATTSDPDNDTVSYRFDWGDGNISGWVGPYASGTPGSTGHAWADGGTFSVRCQAKDVYGLPSNWSEPSSIHILKPNVTIKRIASSLLGISIVVDNVGDANASLIPWSVDCKRLFDYLPQFSQHFEGNITEIAAGGTKRVHVGPLINIGMTQMTIKVYDKVTHATGIILGMMVIVIPTA